MAIVDDRLREELRTRFADRLREPVRLQLFIRPGSGRLILPSGVGCATCPDAREIAEAIAEAGGERISLEVVDITIQPDGVESVPTLRIGPADQEPRIAYQGLPAGFEFATVIDAVERVSRSEVGLNDTSLDRLKLISEPVEVMIFTTPG
jgi:alkyl hydroperoxide reductase subunit AhpF